MIRCNSNRKDKEEIWPHVCGKSKGHTGRCKCLYAGCKKTWMRTIRKCTGVKLHPPKDKRATFVKSDLRATKWNLQK